MFKICFRKSSRLWNNVEKYGTALQATDNNITRLMLIEYRITKATDTHWEYIKFLACQQQNFLRERAFVLHVSNRYIACLVVIHINFHL
jgi:hypothetical protein